MLFYCIPTKSEKLVSQEHTLIFLFILEYTKHPTFQSIQIHIFCSCQEDENLATFELYRHFD